MVEFDDTAITGEIDEEGGKDAAPRQYFIDPDTAEAEGRSLSVLVFSRQCYMCQQGLEEDEVVKADAQVFIDQVAAHCSTQMDYLLPDTPMKEAVFRVLLADGGRMYPEQISSVLDGKWAMTSRPRNIRPVVIRRLLDDSRYYCISPVPADDSS